ncbi:MAG: YraN family protein [Actinomycetota bacterium]
MAKSDKAALLGLLGERLAESYLLHRHYRVIERNWRGAHGEIDLVVTAPDGELVK